MAGAKLKKGIDFIYFSVQDDIDMLDSLRLEFNDRAEIIYHRLRTILGKIHGYYLPWDEKELKKFAFQTRFTADDYALINDVVEYLLHNGIFNDELYQKANILTSFDIQRHYFNVTKRRKELQYNPEYLCPGIAEYIVEVRTPKSKKSNSDEEDILPEDDNGGNYGKHRANINSNNVNINSKNVDTNQPVTEQPVTVSTEVLTVQNPPNSNGLHDVNINSKNVNINSDDVNNNGNNVSRNTTKESKVKQSKVKESKDDIILINQNLSQSDSGVQSSIQNFEKIEPESVEVVSEPEAPPPESEPNHTGRGGPRRKAPHPARADIISIWEKRFSMVYTQTHDGNTALQRILKALENISKARGEPDINHGMLQAWEAIMSNWDVLDAFYADQISFTSINKNFENIIKQIRDRANGTSGKNRKDNSSKSGHDRTSAQVSTGNGFWDKSDS